MRRKLLLVAAVLTVALLGFAAFARISGAAIPGQPLPPLPAELTTAAAGGDSATAARLISRRCGLLAGDPRRKCFEEALLELVRQDRVRFAMSTLALLGEEHDQIRKFGHDYSHVIGINAWTPGKDVGATYLQCTELFQSGCYHGVIQAVFAHSGTDSASVVALCNGNSEIRESAWLRFQCVHGIGHGLLQTYTMNLPRALQGCDMLGNAWDSESCYGGAFMEFIVGGRGQSHHVATDHGEAGHHEAEPDTFPAFKVRDPSDYLYPCSALGDRYQRACYQMQAGLIVERTGLDFAKVAQICEGAPQPMRPVCYQGIGTYVSGVTTRNSAEAIRHCSQGSMRYRSWCFVGVVKNFIDVTAKTQDGIAFCKQLVPQDIATSCYVAVGEQAAVLFRDPARREAVCSTAQPAYLAACRYGAGLSPARPPALPTG
jgi:hypothetical protein